MMSKYIWLLPLLASISFVCVQRYFPDVNFNSFLWNFDVIKTVYSEPVKSTELNSERIFTENELKKYTNLKDGLYLSILGQVFDVSKGEKYYGPGASYHAFIGRDASLAFITGEFDNNGLTDDVSSLSAQQVKALNDWLQFYNKNYIYKGKLNGRYYKEDGTPTVEAYNIQQKLIQAKQEKSMEEQKKRMFPPCNIEWNPETGSIVWCTDKSGGIHRDWIGVPRMYYESPSSKQYRCACVNLESRIYKEAKGMFKEYEDCPRTSTKCAVKIKT